MFAGIKSILPLARQAAPGIGNAAMHCVRRSWLITCDRQLCNNVTTTRISIPALHRALSATSRRTARQCHRHDAQWCAKQSACRCSSQSSPSMSRPSRRSIRTTVTLRSRDSQCRRTRRCWRDTLLCRSLVDCSLRGRRSWHSSAHTSVHYCNNDTFVIRNTHKNIIFINIFFKKKTKNHN